MCVCVLRAYVCKNAPLTEVHVVLLEESNRAGTEDNVGSRVGEQVKRVHRGSERWFSHACCFRMKKSYSHLNYIVDCGDGHLQRDMYELSFYS